MRTNLQSTQKPSIPTFLVQINPFHPYHSLSLFSKLHYIYLLCQGAVFQSICCWRPNPNIQLTTHTMHSWAFLRTSSFSSSSSPSIPRFLSSQRNASRPIFTQSNGSSSSSSSSSCGSSNNNGGGGGGNKKRGRSNSDLESILRSISSGIFVVVGSSLGLSYWSSLSDSNCFLSFADSRGQNENANVNAEPEHKSNFLFGDAYRRKVFFKYEKRIRTQSPPEKVCFFTKDILRCYSYGPEQIYEYDLDGGKPRVFEYFASIRTPSGEVLMMPADLMRAVVPVFPPSESNRIREGYLKGEWIPSELHCAPSIFFMLFDTNNDGLISFADNGEIDKDEFKKVMTLMRTHNRQGARHRDGLRIGLNVSGSVEDGGLLEYFFGKDGKQCLEHGKFVQFLRDLHDEILRLEFAHYDYKSQGTITAKDFALSMVASADMRQVNKFLDRVEELNDEPNLKDIRITFEEFKNLAELRKRLRPLSLAIFSHGKVNGLLTKPDFQRAAYHVCGISLTENVVDMIFYVFDTNHDGSLSSDEFLRVLQRRERDALVELINHPQHGQSSIGVQRKISKKNYWKIPNVSHPQEFACNLEGTWRTFLQI
ncbi:unnamed protein product [Camellia sinensis]